MQTCRTAQFENALRQVAAEIPAGKKEKVLLIEEVNKRQLDLIVWFETESVKAFRGEIEIEEQGERLDNLRKSYESPWHFRRIFTPTIVGTGTDEEKTPASVREAYEAGVEMGRLTRGAKGSSDLMKKTYEKYNKDEATREAFKRGYRKSAFWRN